MINSVLNLIEETSHIIRSKDDKLSFSPKNLRDFELVLFIALNLTRYELLENGKITDLTANVLSQLFAFQCFEYYYRDFPEVYTKTSQLFSLLSDFNLKLKNHDLPGSTSALQDWNNYLSGEISRHLK